MHINMTRPEWGQFRESYVYRVGRGPSILGRVDFIASLGYWWQTAEYTGVCHSLRDAQREVEGALRPAIQGTATLASRAHAESAA